MMIQLALYILLALFARHFKQAKNHPFSVNMRLVGMNFAEEIAFSWVPGRDCVGGL